jgi:hypothetical protein
MVDDVGSAGCGSARAGRRTAASARQTTATGPTTHAQPGRPPEESAAALAVSDPPKEATTSQVRGSRPMLPMNGSVATVPTMTNSTANRASSGCTVHHGAVVSGPSVSWSVMLPTATTARTAEKPFSESWGSARLVRKRFHRTSPP